jgi:hypothetical protein
MWIKQATVALIASLYAAAAFAADLDALCQWRAATGRVSTERRVGIKQPFSEVLTATKLEQLITQDLQQFRP